jgi:hypothetical protein
MDALSSDNLISVLPEAEPPERKGRSTSLSAMDVVFLVLIGALTLFGIGCTILGLLAQLRQNWSKR